MKTGILGRIADVPPEAWNALVPTDNPFLRHEFLNALELSGSVGGDSGWQPCHLLARRNDGSVAGAVPLYLKTHSYGEYVFDFAWAQTAARTGHRYYPKLVAAVPFSPVTGPRLLLAADDERASVAEALLLTARHLADDHGASSIHWLFTHDADTAWLETRGYLRREGMQYHWSNPGYRDFEDFLSAFTADKRKKLKRERRRVAEAGIELEMLAGTDITSTLWDHYYDFYMATIDAHGGTAYLTRDFFHRLGAALPQSTRMVVARRAGQPIAGALFLEGEQSLYGRYWGAREPHPGLHFETCYYTAIEYCIARGLKRFEAGAQGEHKLARGFLPTPTHSAHWLRHEGLARAVADFLRRERNGLTHVMDELSEHAPFKRTS
jgi:predicted N-acyltransferase